MKTLKSILLCLVALCAICGVAQAQMPFDVHVDGFIASQQGRQTLTSASEGPFPGALFRYPKLEIPNRGGVWLGSGAEAKIGRDLYLSVQGSYLFPNNIEGSILLDPGATPRLIPASINSHLDWWYVDGFGAYRMRGPFSVVLGYRYDHHNFYTDSPEILDILFAPLAQLLGVPLGLRLDVNVLSSVPYFGLQLGDSGGGTLRIIYSPWPTINVESTLSQNNGIFRPLNWLGGKDSLSRAQFFELFGQYTGRVAPSLELDFFCRATWLEGKTKTSLSESLVGGAAEYDVSYHRTSWNVGANAKLAFAFADLLYLW